MLELLTDPAAWVSFLTLTILEIVLGVDNVIFISIASQRLPMAQQPRARFIGLSGALVLRILLLLSITWIIGLTRPIFTDRGLRRELARPAPARRRAVPDLEGDDRDLQRDGAARGGPRGRRRRASRR